ncbi:MAG: hypothetical protein KDA85_19765, partial [Planctomycetaceae bacterium]|nr:hypothetical protein [Planctomycetaceae bacterium]
LQQNLQYEVDRLETLEGVSGDAVLTDPLFMDNVLTFAVPYGLALQALGKTRIHTNLLPPEILVDRKIRRKKPVAVAAAAGLLLAIGVGLGASNRVAASWSADGPLKWGTVESEVQSFQGNLGSAASGYSAENSNHETVLKDIDTLVAPLEKRVMWLELIKAVNVCLPRLEGKDLDETDVTKQPKMRIVEMTTKKLADVSEWHKAMIEDQKEEEFFGNDGKEAPTGEGYIVTLKGYHLYSNESLDDNKSRKFFTTSTLIQNLRQWTATDGQFEVPVAKLGISHPLVVWTEPVPVDYNPDNANAAQMMAATLSMTSGGGGGGMGMPAGGMGGGGYSPPG